MRHLQARNYNFRLLKLAHASILAGQLSINEIVPFGRQIEFKLFNIDRQTLNYLPSSDEAVKTRDSSGCSFLQ